MPKNIRKKSLIYNARNRVKSTGGKFVRNFAGINADEKRN